MNEYADADTVVDGQGSLLVVETDTMIDPVRWVEAHRDRLDRDLLRYGAVLLRGLDVDGAAGFSAVARTFAPDLLDYVERAAPRTEVADRVFTSTEMSPDRPIEMHHEMSYSHRWPGRLYFYCDTVPDSGGATPLAGERRVHPRIPPEVRERFVRHGVRYVRNYGPHLDLPWQDVFQTSDPDRARAYCHAAGTRVEWTGSDNLRTVSERPAVTTHPRTGETVWFNHAHLFHPSTLSPEVVEVLLSEYGPDGLPRDVRYGDGAPIEDEVITLICTLYAEARIRFDWCRGDVLVVDNVLTVHGREPFRGERQVLVAMSHPDTGDRSGTSC